MNRVCVKTAALVCTLFALSAASAAAGEATPTGGVAFVDPPVSAPQGAFAGKAGRVTGRAGDGGENVSIDARIATGQWLRVADTTTGAGGSFTIVWTPPQAGSWEFRITPGGTAARVADAPTTGILNVYRLQKATWYGPGLYGRRTACGQKLTRRTLGVAHKRLACGTRVEIYAAGRRITVPVIDRGPFAHGAAWDLTYATASRLGVLQTTMLGVLPLG